MLTNPAGLNDVTSAIIGAAIEVHKECGPGLLEGVSVGLLINFNVPLLKDGIHRVVRPTRAAGQQRSNEVTEENGEARQAGR